jgi:hypothetical protein
MGMPSPFHLLILLLIALLLLGGYRQIRARSRSGRRFFGAVNAMAFFAGMNPTTSLALSGAMLLALSLLVDVYGADWTSGVLSDNVSLGLAGSGGGLTLLSFFVDHRTRKRRG